MNTANADHGDAWAYRLTAFVDGELDVAQAAATEAHLLDCAECREAAQSARAVHGTVAQDGVSWRMPAHVLAQILGTLDQEGLATGSMKPGWTVARLLDAVRKWSFVPSAAALAAGLALFLATPRAGQSLQDQILASHIHSLLADHLMDVVSTDQHTVKPWFNGKADFSPPVVDLAAQGFPLIGGRLDYIGGRTVATAVYKRREHIINLFMWPAGEVGMPNSGKQGYTILSWTAHGTVYCAVSDVSVRDLEALRHDLLQASGS